MFHFLQNNITFLVTTFTLVSNIVFVFILVLLFIPNFRSWVYVFVNKNISSLLFLTSFAAVVGSLSYSNIIGFPPCELCWFQRIFMYPQAIIAFMAVMKKDKSIVSYLLPLSILGTIVAFYHSLVHWGFGTGLLGCTAIGGDCGKVYVLEYGYITIPFMALSCFIYLIAISIIYYKSNGNKLA